MMDIKEMANDVLDSVKDICGIGNEDSHVSEDVLRTLGAGPYISCLSNGEERHIAPIAYIESSIPAYLKR